MEKNILTVKKILTKDHNSFKTVGDSQHSEIISLYIEQGLSMSMIAKKLNMSPATIHKHISEHNEAVARSQFCPSCRRVNGKHYNQTTNH